MRRSDQGGDGGSPRVRQSRGFDTRWDACRDVGRDPLAGFGSNPWPRGIRADPRDQGELHIAGESWSSIRHWSSRKPRTLHMLYGRRTPRRERNTPRDRDRNLEDRARKKSRRGLVTGDLACWVRVCLAVRRAESPEFQSLQGRLIWQRVTALRAPPRILIQSGCVSVRKPTISNNARRVAVSVE